MSSRRQTLFLLVALLGFLALATVAFAQGGDRCHISAEQHITGNFIGFCERLQLDGRVDGAVIVFATEAEIGGQVGGDVYILATRLDLRGELKKDLHYAGGMLEVHPEARFGDERASILAATLQTRLQRGASLPGDYLGVGYQLLLAGELGGALEYLGSSLELSGTVSGDLRATVGDAATNGITQLQPLLNLLPLPLEVELMTPGLSLAEGGVVEGDLQYQAPRPAPLAGRIGGRLLYEATPASAASVVVSPGGWQRYWRNALREFVVLAAIASGTMLLASRPLNDALRHMRERPLPSFGIGLLTFILSFPVVLLVALVSGLLLLPLNWLGSDLLLYGALLVGMVDFGLLSLFYFGAIFLSRVVAAVALGRWFSRRWRKLRSRRAGYGGAGSAGQAYALALMGCALLAFLSSLPYVGWALNAFAAFFGLGAMASALRHRLRVLRLPAPPPPRYETTHPTAGAGATPPLPPPLSAEVWRMQPGMENLPPGFRWWDDEGDDGETEKGND